MKEYIKSSYLVPSSKSIILENGQTINQGPGDDTQELVMVQLNRVFLKDVEYLQYCTSIRICNLSNNYITCIEPLSVCTQLVKLDLHGNQIQLLPNKEFWAEMEELKLLYLHDNGIEKLLTVQVLSACTSLVGLTLFDTPVSLKDRYRHIVVNSLFSLKALDYYVISDEEIIQDCVLPDRFKPLNPRLYLNLLPALRTDANFQGEMNEVNRIISAINSIMAHNSPLLIIQRSLRGYLARKHLCGVPPSKQPKDKSCCSIGESKMLEDDTDYNQGRKRCALSFAKPVKSNQDGHLLHKKQASAACRSPSPDHRLTRITIDLHKLEKEITQALQRENSAGGTLHASLGDQKQLLGSILSKAKKEDATRPRRSSKSSVKETTDEPDLRDQEKTEFRLSGFKANLYQPEAMSNILNLHKELAKDVRRSDILFHSKPHELPARPRSLEQQEFIKSESMVKFSTFYAVDKAYEERQKKERLEEKMRKVIRVQTGDKEAKLNIHGFLVAKKNEALRKREVDGLNLQKAGERQSQHDKQIEYLRGQYKQFKELKKQKEADHEFVRAFRTKHNTIAKTLLNHDRARVREATVLEKQRLLQDFQQEREEKKVLLRELTEYRQSMLQRENAAEKAERSDKVYRKAHDRLQQARERVTALKAHHATTEPMHKTPVVQSAYNEAYHKYFST